MKINIKPNTIILLIGPSNCGKSTFAYKIKSQIDGVFSENNDCEIVSSDDQRRYLLGRDAHKYDGDMMYMSHHAFKLLNEKVYCLTSYPVNKKYVIVDSTGLSESFRNDIIRIAKKNNYNIDCVIFRFKNKEEYYEGVDGKYRYIVEKHVNRLFKKESANIPSRDYGQKIILNTRVDPEVILEKESGIKISGRTLVTGDIHGCLSELKELLDKADYEKYENVVINGDCIDKGPDSEGVLDFVMQKGFITTRGNHENYVLKAFNGEIEHKPELDEYFDSVYNTSQTFKDKLQAYWDRSYDWVEHDDYIITHSPCESKYLLKSDDRSAKMQRNYRHIQHEDGLGLVDTILSFYESNIFTKKHIFGHIPFERVWNNKNFIALDTGCTQRGKLSAFDTETKEIFQVDGGDYSKKEVYKIKEKKIEIDLSSLNKWELNTVNNFVNNKVNFISGTVCPAGRVEDNLESLDWALDYYSDKTDSITLQPKYMGSRFQVYLFEKPEDCYGITRNGYRPNLDLIEEYSRLIERFREDFENGLYLRILDCELLPWRVLGGDLIDRSFYGYYDLLQTKYNKETEYQFYNAIQQVKDNIPKDGGELNKSDYIEKYGHSALVNRNMHSFLRCVPKMNQFKIQADLYGGDGKSEIKPFNILKDVYIKSDEIFETVRVDESNYDKWKIINDDYSLHLEFKFPSFRDAAHEFFNTLTTKQGFEGVVVKPDIVGDLIPYIKVRNTDYLQLVYGPDYQEEKKFNKLLHRKRINGKLTKSKDDYDCGVKLLNEKYDSLNNDNISYMKTLSKFVISERQNERIDPRL